MGTKKTSKNKHKAQKNEKKLSANTVKKNTYFIFDSKYTYIWFILIASVFITIFVINAIGYLSFIEDDALISLRYVKRFVAGEGLTWTNGPKVEGYSNLLWILLCSAISIFGIEPIDSARILGFALNSAIIMALVWYFLKNNNIYKSAAAMTAAALIAFSGPFAVWTVGGLEQPLVAFLLCLGILFLIDPISQNRTDFRSFILPGIFLGLLSLTRPDGILFPAVIALFYFILNRFRKQAFLISLKFFLIPFSFYLLQLAFRLIYYGEWIPNTALVKVSFSSSHFWHGLQYTLEGIINLLPLFLLLLFSIYIIFKAKKFSSIAIILSGSLLLWLIYLTIVGGDIFPGRRHFVPVILISVILISLAISQLNELKNHYPKSLLLFVLPFIAAFAYMQYDDKENLRVKEENWEQNGQAIGLLLKKAFHREQPLLAVTSAGCIPYWSELPSLDMLGLNDYYLPRHKPKNFGYEWIAHELSDANYIMSQKPDIVIYNMSRLGRSAVLRAEIELYNHKDFKKLYSGMTVFCREPQQKDIMVFFRKDSEKIGIRHFGDTLYIPGYLIANNPTITVSMLDLNNNLVCLVNKKNPAYLYDIQLDQGLYKFEIIAKNKQVFAAVREGEIEIGRGNGSFTFEYNAIFDVNFGIWGTSEQPDEIIGIRLIKIPNP